MSAHRIIKSVIFCLSVTSTTSAAWSQQLDDNDHQTASVLHEWEADVQRLIWNAEAAERNYGKDSTQYSAALEQLLNASAILQQHLDIKQRLQDGFVEIQKHFLERQVGEFDEATSEAKARSQNILKQESQIVMSSAALRIMALKIGETQIEHRLRELEAEATIEALKNSSPPKISDVVASRIAVAERVLEMERTQLQRLKALAKSNIAGQEEVAGREVRVMEAEAVLLELQYELKAPDDRHQRLSEAATQKMISVKMQQLLLAEAKEINGLLQNAASAELYEAEAVFFREQMQDLRRQLLQLRSQSDATAPSAMKAIFLLELVKKMKLTKQPVRKDSVDEEAKDK